MPIGNLAKSGTFTVKWLKFTQCCLQDAAILHFAMGLERLIN
jgi:hypothetical protein